MTTQTFKERLARLDLAWSRHGLVSKLWWKVVSGPSIQVKWPIGEIRIRQEESDIWDYVRSADPNDHYRPWLEENVGKQYWDWDWRIGSVDPDTVEIKFRRNKAPWATMASLLWG
jgi:hypothetical protein